MAAYVYVTHVMWSGVTRTIICYIWSHHTCDVSLMWRFDAYDDVTPMCVLTHLLESHSYTSHVWCGVLSHVRSRHKCDITPRRMREFRHIWSHDTHTRFDTYEFDLSHMCCGVMSHVNVSTHMITWHSYTFRHIWVWCDRGMWSHVFWHIWSQHIHTRHTCDVQWYHTYDMSHLITSQVWCKCHVSFQWLCMCHITQVMWSDFTRTVVCRIWSHHTCDLSVIYHFDRLMLTSNFSY